MSDFNHWAQDHLQLMGLDMSGQDAIFSSWRPVIESAFEKLLDFKQCSLTLSQAFPSEGNIHDWDFWFQRALKRDHSHPVIYDVEKDQYRDLGLTFKTSDTVNTQASPLGLTPKGTRRALFFDRDGIINIDEGYVSCPSKVEFIKGVEELIGFCNRENILVVVLTNQSGVGRGYYSEEDVIHLHEWMNGELGKKGAKVDAWYFSPYHPDSKDSRYKRESITRKPRPGMALMAAYDHSIDVAKSAMIGDKVSDVLSHLDLFTVLYKGNYELGNYSPVVSNHQESLKLISSYFLSK